VRNPVSALFQPGAIAPGDSEHLPQPVPLNVHRDQKRRQSWGNIQLYILAGVEEPFHRRGADRIRLRENRGRVCPQKHHKQDRFQ
jgi:hypothetical protein